MTRASLLPEKAIFAAWEGMVKREGNNSPRLATSVILRERAPTRSVGRRPKDLGACWGVSRTRILQSLRLPQDDTC